MAADVDDAVRDHVAACAECARDLTLLRSLLDREGQATEPADGGDAETVDPRAATAMADAAEPRPAVHHTEPATTPRQESAEPATSDPGSRSRFLVVALAAMVVAVGLLVIALALWR